MIRIDNQLIELAKMTVSNLLFGLHTAGVGGSKPLPPTN